MAEESNTVLIGGMFGGDRTYFAGSPVIITVTGLKWPDDGQGHITSPFTIVCVEVLYGEKACGEFKSDTGGQTEAAFDISSALRAIWSDYDFASEVEAACNAAESKGRDPFSPADRTHHTQNGALLHRDYSLKVYTEYIDSKDGELTRTESGTFSGGMCIIGSMTEWERANFDNPADGVGQLAGKNKRNGDASTKPNSSPERVGKHSITSWTGLSVVGTRSVFYPSAAEAETDKATAHAPLVLRDTVDYQDFVFVNRRGALETCSALMNENMGIEVTTKQYSKVETPTFKPSRSLMTITEGGPRRSWQMSSGYVGREWAEWWAMEFLPARRVWMLYGGTFVPVTVKPAKNETGIYDRAKQQMPHVDFTVTLGLEG